MHPSNPAFINVTDHAGKTQRYDRLTWEQFEDLFARGHRIEIGNIGLALGGYGEFLLAGTPLCYGHTWIETNPNRTMAR
jgi:hypothetical protein